MPKVSKPIRAINNIIKRLEALAEPLLTAGTDIHAFTNFLTRYFSYILTTSELKTILDYYAENKKRDIATLKAIEDELSKSVRKEIERIFTKDVLDIDRIRPVLEGGFDDPDSLPSDGQYLLDSYTAMIEGNGHKQYLMMKNLIEYMNIRRDDIYSFACSDNELKISSVCQSAYEEWRRQYDKINLEGRPWLAYLQLYRFNQNPSKKADLTQLKNYSRTLHADLKQELKFNWSAPKEELKPLPVPQGVYGYVTQDGGYAVEIPNNKRLVFIDKDEPICRCFQIYFNNYGIEVKHQEVLDYVGDPKKNIKKLMAALKGKISKDGFGFHVLLESEGKGAYKLIILPFNDNLPQLASPVSSN